MTAHNRPIWVIGLMSGTSLDGIDVALLQTDGHVITDRGPAAIYPFENTIKTRLHQALGSAIYTPVLRTLEHDLTTLHASCVKDFLATHTIDPATVDLVGFHGLTVYHKPPTAQEHGRTWQIGDGKQLAHLLQTPVVYDFRSHDVACGGHGAPLMPIFHQAIAPDHTPSVIVNIGGVSNLTVCNSGPLKGFDCGPGNALIDDWVGRFGHAYDHNGAFAASGHVDTVIVDHLLQNSFYTSPPPKSLDRNVFRTQALEAISHLCRNDGAATLTSLTARGLAAATQWVGDIPKLWYIAGGGSYNTTLMMMVRDALHQISSHITVQPLSTLHWEADTLEAYGFAYLAARTYYDLPISFPGTTGAPSPLKGGILIP